MRGVKEDIWYRARGEREREIGGTRENRNMAGTKQEMQHSNLERPPISLPPSLCGGREHEAHSPLVSITLGSGLGDSPTAARLGRQNRSRNSNTHTYNLYDLSRSLPLPLSISPSPSIFSTSLTPWLAVAMFNMRSWIMFH